jgi:predicted ATPase
MLLTSRPEFTPPWHPHSYLSQLTLTRFTRVQVEEMIQQVIGEKSPPPEVVEHIVTKTDGVPLFVEELVKMILESGLVHEEAGHYILTAPLPPLAIPTTLQDSLMARLDRLGVAKEIAQLGAVLGREFSYDMLHAIAPMDEPMLQRGLAQLVDAELFYQHGHLPQATYTFKHALVQDTAYQSLLRSTRQQYHEQVAQVLVKRFSDTVEAQPELLAHHYTAAGLSTPAISYWQHAGERANARSANTEAISHLRRGLALLTTLPDTSERLQYELALPTTLGQVLKDTKGYGAAEVAQVYTRV